MKEKKKSRSAILFRKVRERAREEDLRALQVEQWAGMDDRKAAREMGRRFVEALRGENQKGAIATLALMIGDLRAAERLRVQRSP
jgi:hypothetical protein